MKEVIEKGGEVVVCIYIYTIDLLYRQTSHYFNSSIYRTTYSLSLENVISQFPLALHHLFMPDTTVRRKKDRHEEQQTPDIVIVI